MPIFLGPWKNCRFSFFVREIKIINYFLHMRNFCKYQTVITQISYAFLMLIFACVSLWKCNTYTDIRTHCLCFKEEFGISVRQTCYHKLKVCETQSSFSYGKTPSQSQVILKRVVFSDMD